MNPTPSSPLALAVLALLCEEPMHPYRMQRLIKQRGKDEVINVEPRAGLYQTIERLQRAGLIEVREIVQQEGRPGRTVYQVTEAGRATALRWMRELLSTPAREYPSFPAALAHLALLTPEAARQALEQRTAALAAELSRIDAAIASTAGMLPRLFLVEAEYQRTLVQCELAWVRAIVADLASGALAWDAAWLREVAERLEHVTWQPAARELASKEKEETNDQRED